MSLFNTLFIACLVLINNVQAQIIPQHCNQCLINDVYCDGRDVYYCMDGKKVPDLIKTCAGNEFCSGALYRDCISDSENYSGVPVCYEYHNSDFCREVCYEREHFICRSATEYSTCNGTTPSETKQTCPKGTYCSERLFRIGAKSLCAPPYILDFMNTKPTCLGMDVPSSEATIALQRQCLAAKLNGQYNNKYFFIPKEGDVTCKNYIHCEISDDIVAATVYSCANGLTFEPMQQKCLDNYVCPTLQPTPPCRCSSKQNPWDFDFNISLNPKCNNVSV